MAALHEKSFSHHFELDLNLPFRCWDRFGLPTPTLLIILRTLIMMMFLNISLLYIFSFSWNLRTNSFFWGRVYIDMIYYDLLYYDMI